MDTRRRERTILMKPGSKMWLFTVVTLLFSALLWGSLAVLGVQAPNLESGENTSTIVMVLFILNGFIPSILGVLLLLKTEEDGRKYLASVIPRKKNLKTVFVILIIFICCFVVQVFLYEVFIGDFRYIKVLGNLYQVFPLIILGPISEEVGWRGYLQRQILKVTTPFKGTLFIGVVWSLWHLPLFYILGTTQQVNDVNFLSFAIMLIVQSWIMTYFYMKNEQSLFISVFIHWGYTVVMTFFVLGTVYSVLGDLLAMLPFLLLGLIFLVLYRKRKEEFMKY